MIICGEKETFSYSMAGLFHGTAGWIHPDRVIDSFEILIGMEGTAYIQEEERQFALHRDEVLLLQPGKRHFGYRPSEDKVSFTWLHFIGSRKPEIGFFPLKEGYELQQMMKRLLHAANSPGYDRAVCDALCYLIVREAERMAKSGEGSGSALVGEISEYIRVHRWENVTVEELSRKFGYHRDYLGKLFRRVTGTGLKDCIAENRMAASKELLLTTDLSVSEIGYRLAFPTPNTFVKFFTYHEGISPLAFRNRYDHIHINIR